LVETKGAIKRCTTWIERT